MAHKSHHHHRLPVKVPSAKLKAEMAQHFSLRKIIFLLGEYASPPAAGFDPDGHWEHSYYMYVLAGGLARPTGEFSLSRSPKGSGQFVFKTLTQRRGNSEFSQFQHGEFQCKSDTLATPVSWIYDTKMARQASDAAYLQTGKRRKARVADGMLALSDSWRTRKKPLRGDYSNEWTILDAVQRLSAKQADSKYNYTLINEYDTPQPDHTLAYRGKAKVSFRNGPATLTAYDDLGDATVPTTYWLDEHHRLLFVCTGLMVYALRSSNGHSGSCPKSYPALRTYR